MAISEGGRNWCMNRIKATKTLTELAQREETFSVCALSDGIIARAISDHRAELYRQDASRGR